VLGLKKNAARSRFQWALTCVLVCAGTASTYAAEARVLLLESHGPSGGLFTALQIQLSGVASPERVAVPASPNMAEGIERGSQLVREHGAIAAVWVERGRTPGPAVLYVVGEKEGRALVEVVRVPGDRGPELERTIALKVREFVAAIQRGQAARAEAAQLLQPEPPQPQAAGSGQAPASETLEPEQHSEPQPEPGRNEDLQEATTGAPAWATALAIGVRLGSQPDLGLGRWGFGLTGGPVLELNGLRLAAALHFDAFPSVEVERAGGDLVRFWEWAFGAALHAQVHTGAIWLGGRAGPELVGLDAYGRTGSGREGPRQQPTSWALHAALDAEIPLSHYINLAASLQLQALAQRLKLDVNRHSLVDIGRLRARIGLDLLARF
jgi:hypothetical protein